MNENNDDERAKGKFNVDLLSDTPPILKCATARFGTTSNSRNISSSPAVLRRDLRQEQEEANYDEDSDPSQRFSQVKEKEEEVNKGKVGKVGGELLRKNSIDGIDNSPDMEEVHNHQIENTSSIMELSQNSNLQQDTICNDEEGLIEDEHKHLPTISILNVVIDFIMSSPTPFEPEEYKWKQLQKRQQQQKQHMQRYHESQSDDDVSSQIGDLNEDVQVPILRIFGPIVRGKRLDLHQRNNVSSRNEATKPKNDNNYAESMSISTPNNSDHSPSPTIQQTSPSSCSSSQSPGKSQVQQSGCLHIHGAYPYLLARPVKSGADASSCFNHQQPNHNDNNKTEDEQSYDYESNNGAMNIDWDDEQSVSSIIDDIHIQLEAALKSSVEEYTNNPNDAYDRINEKDGISNNQETASMGESLPTRFIRKITIVRGRGFYTYCVGSAAPFLRIEYYNPNNRWRVKVMLERGLELPLSYHPVHDSGVGVSGGRGQHNSGRGGERVDSDIDLLQFRCYEAHIPYTMQFFKDWNLAGMSWVNIGDVRFRDTLPHSCKARYEMENGSTESDSTQLLLQDNIPMRYQWTKPKVDHACEKKGSIEDEPWTQKDTSCDIEVDTIASNILNVNEIMTKLPSQSEEEIHWRAVPSLREIWAEERQRMATLLPPKDNFLSGDNGSLSFTLSVKKGAPTPGYKLAAAGNLRLFDSSPSLLGDFQKAMMDIVHKHDSMLKVLDKLLKDGSEKVNNTAIVRKNIEVNQEQNLSHYLSPKDDALLALEGLLNQFSTPIPSSMISKDDIVNGSGFRSMILTPSKSSRLSQIQPNVPLTQVDQDEVNENLAFCRDTDFGDIAMGDTIDPTSLTLYGQENDENVLDEECLMEEEEFEKSLNILGTQKPQLSSESLSQLESVVNSWAGSQSKSELDIFPFAQESLSSEEHEQSLSPNSVENQHCTPKKKAQLAVLSSESPAIGIKKGDMIELTAHPPNMSFFHGSTPIRLHPNNHNDNLRVSWLGYSSSTFKETNILFDTKSWQGKYIEPVVGPPSLRRVRRWVNRQRKASKSFKTKLDKTKRKIETSNEREDALEFDANTRKLLRVRAKKKQRVAFAEDHQLISSSTAGLIEEVQWTEGSQDLTQDSSETVPSKGINSAKNPGSYQINLSDQSDHAKYSEVTQISAFTMQSDSPQKTDPLQGIGNQGGKIYVEGGGLKASVSTSRVQQKQLSMMSIEVHVQCRTGKAGANNSREIAMKPDPNRDSAFAVCYVYAFDPGGGEQIQIIERGCIFVPTANEKTSFRNSANGQNKKDIMSKIGKTMGVSSKLKIETVPNEKQLLLRISSIVQWKDPDALFSWDTQSLGLGYLIERGLALGRNEHNGCKTAKVDMVRLLGRTPKRISSNDENIATIESEESKEKQQWSGSGLGADWDDRVGAGAGPSSIVGRLILNGWKIMSEEVKHPNASYLPAMTATVLKKRIPHHDELLLTRWYGGNKGVNRWRVIKYRMLQAVTTILLFDALDIIGRAGEAARLSGVEFSQSFPGIRGSQYKVEGVLLRSLQSLVADEEGKERNYFFYSPSKNDCGNQEALECQAMTLEPQSGFHFDPVVVCDFTALYPSLVIAYNLCYSTIAGKLEYHSTRREMRQTGRTTEKLGPFDYSEAKTAFVANQLIHSLKAKKNEETICSDRAMCMPTGSIYVSENVMKGVLPSVLDEMLSTRAMLKKAAKQYRKQLKSPPAAVLRQLEARQLALKYVANVTYGYTSATFSGRSAMPLLADTIVECGRRTLSNAIALATDWGTDPKGKYFGAEVIYGDTDSIFIKLPGRSVKEAFDFGKDFCDSVTASNPPPVQLKLEKVYGATLLQTKKKYCGMKYESPDEKTPTFEAKGIETIRKDQCSLTQKILQNALMTVFRDKGLHRLRDYLFRQWALIHAGRLPVSDFILTGRVRSQYRGKVGPVQAALARRLAEADPGRTVQHKERLAYVIVASPGRNFKLRDCVLTPNELLSQWDSYTIHAAYYATKHVNAALNRCFSLAPWKINIHAWYDACPKPQKRIHHWPITRTGGNSMISAYFGSDQCAICASKCRADGISKAVICSNCKKDKGSAVFLATGTLNAIQRQANKLASICESCNGCFESSGTFAVEKAADKRTINSRKNVGLLLLSSNGRGLESPLSNCTCIDCPITYKRHEMRESEIEALALCKALHAFDD